MSKLYYGHKLWSEFGLVQTNAKQTVSVYMKREGSTTPEEMITFAVVNDRLVFSVNTAQMRGEVEMKRSTYGTK